MPDGHKVAAAHVHHLCPLSCQGSDQADWLQLEDDLLYKLSSAEGDMTEDLALIESLEESKRVADEISEKVAEAKTTEEQINEARNKVCKGPAQQHVAALLYSPW